MSEENLSAPGGFAPGSRIAGYLLEEQIGRGGMAVVFRARDERLGRQVALKILSPALSADNAFRQRFIGESRAAAAVDDPHIIPVFEAGEASGVLFIAMRYVPGGDVRTLLDQSGPLPPERAAGILGQVASALDNAHAHGLVHRDVKPANMLLGSVAGPDQPDHIYLSDFGLSKHALASTGLTSTGQFLGTLDYVAPEQIEGRPADGSADQYALACAAFEILSGAPPFRRDQGMAVMYAQVSEPPPALSQRRPGLPPAADAVLARALAKAPADRFGSCREFVAALREAFGLAARHSGPGHTMTGQPSRPATEIAMPVSKPQDVPPAAAAAVGPAAGAAASGQDQPSAPRPPSGKPDTGGPPTAAAEVVAGRSTRPGLTDPRYRGPGAPGGGSGGGPGGSGGGDSGPPGPGRRRSRTALIAAAVVVVLVLGGGAYALLGRGSGSSGGKTVALPGCTTSTAAAPLLATVKTSSVTVGGHPFAVQVGRSGQFSFVSLSNNSVAMLANDNGSLSPAIRRTIQAPGAVNGMAIAAIGGTNYLLVAGGSGAVVISVKEAKTAANPVVGHLQSPASSSQAQAQEVAVSPDGQWAFVTLKGTGQLAVFNLKKALGSGFRSGFTGFVPVGSQPVGIAQQGKWLYVTNMGPNPAPSKGTVSVIDMTRAESAPSRAAVVATAPAGCNPSRVITSADGSVVWATTQRSNALLAFSASKLRSDPGHALMAKVAVGQNPIGEILIRGGAQIVVADSDKYDVAGSGTDLMVVDTGKALAGKPALVGRIATGKQPRQFAVEGDKTLLVTNTGSGQLQAVSIGSIPGR